MLSDSTPSSCHKRKGLYMRSMVIVHMEWFWTVAQQHCRSYSVFNVTAAWCNIYQICELWLHTQRQRNPRRALQTVGQHICSHVLQWRLARNGFTKLSQSSPVQIFWTPYKLTLERSTRINGDPVAMIKHDSLFVTSLKCAMAGGRRMNGPRLWHYVQLYDWCPAVQPSALLSTVGCQFQKLPHHYC